MGAPIELRFADFEVSLRSGELRRNGTKIKLQEQPFQILVLLLEQRGEVVTRDELRQKLWTADTFVDFDNGLNIAIKKLRTALSDDADDPRYIETLPRRGYRFIAPVTAYEFRAPGSSDTFDAILGKESTAPLQAKPEASQEPLQITQKETGRERERDSDSDSGHHSSAKPAQLRVVKRETGRGTAITEPDASGASVRLGASGAANTSSRSGPIASVWLALALALTLLISIGSALMYRQAHQRPKLTDKDTIVLGSITNRTNDPAFDESLTQVLRIALEQSPFLQVLSKEKVFRTLEQTHRSTNTPLSRDLALDVCIRTSSKLLVDGNISDLGNRYRLDLTAVQCDTGKILSSVTAEPENRERIVHDLGITALQFRSDMGEPRESLRQFDQPIELATSASIEALGAYAQGHAILGAPEAIPLMSRAVQLDSNFALAYDDLATDYYNIKSYELANWNAEKAYGLSSRLAKASRYSVEKNYYRRTGELEKLVAVAEQWRQVYPNSEAHNALSFSYRILGNLEESAAQGREAVRIAPDDPRAYINLAGAYIETDQFGEARRILDEARTKGIESRWLASARYEVAFFLSDSDAMREEVSAARGKPGNEAVVLATRAYTEASYGHQRKSRQDWLQAINSAKHYNLPGGAAWQALEALQEAESGNHSRTTLLITGILNSDKDKEDASVMALALARSGETEKALEVTDELNQRGPRDIILQNYQLPEIRAAVELQRHNPAKAIEMLRAVVPYELGGLDPAYLYPAYLRGLAYLEAGRAPEATLEFRKLIAHRGVTYGWIIGTLAHLQLARAQAMMGDKEAARRSYQGFLALWKDADPDVPIYRQAKAEYAKLMKPSATTSQALLGTKSVKN